jgi:hypothetical protein
MVESLTTTTLVASDPLANVTNCVPVKPVPVIVIGVPPVAGPDTGESPVTVTGPVLAMGPESPPCPTNVGSVVAIPAVLPTGTHVVAVTQETPVNPAVVFTIGPSVQAFPSHCSMRLCVVKGPCAGLAVDVVCPTAVQAESEAHEIAESWL